MKCSQNPFYFSTEFHFFPFQFTGMLFYCPFTLLSPVCAARRFSCFHVLFAHIYMVSADFVLTEFGITACHMKKPDVIWKPQCSVLCGKLLILWVLSTMSVSLAIASTCSHCLGGRLLNDTQVVPCCCNPPGMFFPDKNIPVFS